MTALKDMTEKEAMDLIVTTHSNISEIEFNNLVKKWAQNATHPETKMTLCRYGISAYAGTFAFSKDKPI